VHKLQVCICAVVFVGVSVSAFATDCPGNPDALGTSRVLAIGPDKFSHVGSMQYKETLPLNDHEVVITFDDSPLPPYTDIILKILASQCVRANYFLIGRMAKTYPYLVRRIYNGGHTVGTHTLDHPLFLKRLPMRQVEHEIDGGIASVEAAIGDPKAVAPFFRSPGLARSDALDTFLASKSLAPGVQTSLPMTGSGELPRARSCNVLYSGSMLKAAASCCCTTSIQPQRSRYRACSRNLRSAAIRRCT
jgi:peptidoglycan/xylan/chitin deacetylase (PgdA/CDA1 family)